MNDHELAQYARQILMPTIGIEQQQRLFDSTVLIVGAGGLGNTVAQYLVGSGIGQLLIVDHDVIELSNLPRQILFTEADIGKPKAEIVCQRLNQRWESSPCQAFNVQYSEELIQQLMEEYAIDVVIDAGDSLLLSHQLDKSAAQYQLPLVHASVGRFEGHCYTRLPNDKFPSLVSLFPVQSEQETCSQSGVLTVAVGLIGAYQATTAVRVLLADKLGEILPELVLFDGKTMRFLSVAVGKNSG